jgi:hypothetical protein
MGTTARDLGAEKLAFQNTHVFRVDKALASSDNAILAASSIIHA